MRGPCLAFKEEELRMQELIDSLERCVMQSTFVFVPHGKNRMERLQAPLPHKEVGTIPHGCSGSWK